MHWLVNWGRVCFVMKLTQLPKGALAIVTGLTARPDQESLARRLLLMGIRPGAQIQMMGRAPFGDPYVVKVRNQGFGLRRELTELIEVKAGD